MEDNTLIDRRNKKNFAQIENCILRNPLFSLRARVLYGILDSYCFGKNNCFPGQYRLAQEMGVSETYVRQTIRELKGWDLITIKRRGLGLSNIYIMEAISYEIKGKFSVQQINLTVEVQGERKTKEEKFEEREYQKGMRNGREKVGRSFTKVKKW